MRDLLLILAACCLLFVLGCSDQATSPSTEPAAAADDTAMPESVQELLDSYALPRADLPEGVSIVGPTELPPYLYDTAYDAYVVTIIWGSLCNSITPTGAGVDWSGTASVPTPARVMSRLTIGFEPGQDWLLPIFSSNSIAWVSWTSFDFDGVSFWIFQKHDETSVEPQELTFSTDPFTKSWTFKQLERFCAFYLIDDVGAVAIHARKIRNYVCPWGVIVGEWIKADATGREGRIEGWWLAHQDDPVTDAIASLKGLMVGRFWTNDDGTGEFEGSLSGVFTDQVLAEFEGRWHYDDPTLCPMCGQGHGVFEGVYRSLEDNTTTGTIRGEFGENGTFYDVVALPLRGTWHQDCPNLADVAPNIAE